MDDLSDGQLESQARKRGLMAAEDGEIAKTEEVSSCLQAIAMCHLLVAFLLPTSRFVLICCA